MRSLARAGRSAGALVLIGVLLGVYFGGFGIGFGTGPGTKDAASSPEAEEASDPGEVPAVLVVLIDGSQYKIGNRSHSAESVAKLAASRTDVEGKASPATVEIKRAENATRGAREDLVGELRKRDVLYKVQ